MRTFKADPCPTLLIIALLFLLSSTLDAQGWERKYGPGHPHSIQAGPDGSAWLFYTNNDLYAQHVGAAGDSLGFVHLGWAGADVWPVAGGFVKAGKRGGWYGLDSLAVEKRSGTGQVTWKRHFADTVLLHGVAMAPAPGGQILVASLPQRVVGQPFPAMTKNLTLRLLDAAGATVWEKMHTDDLPYLTLTSLRQMVMLADGSAVLLLNVSYSGDDRSFRLWHFDAGGNFLGDIEVNQESSFTSGYSLNVVDGTDLLLASEWSDDGGHHAVWRSLAGGAGIQFEKNVAALTGPSGLLHQPAPLAMVRLECGRYLTLMHQANFTLEAWSPSGDRLWQHAVPGPPSAGYYTPAYPPARFGAFLLALPDGGALTAVPDNGKVRLMKLDCSGRTSASGAIVKGRAGYDTNANCLADPDEEAYPFMPLEVRRGDELSALIWTDEKGRFNLPLDTGAWILQPAAGSLLPEPGAGCSFLHHVVVDGNTETLTSDFMLASGLSPTASPDETAGWRVYPNPVADRLVLERPDGAVAPVLVNVWTAQGQLVFSGRPEGAAGPTWSVPAGGWAPGVYSIRVESPDGARQFKVVKAGQ